MIRRLYVDNYKSLVDFTWEPGKETLVLGYNGSGKTSALDAIDLIRRWVKGAHLGETLSENEFTRWKSSPSVKFELDIEIKGGLFRYLVEFDNRDEGYVFVTNERLRLGDGRDLFIREDHLVHIYVDGEVVESYPFPRTQSAFGLAYTVEHLFPGQLFDIALQEMVLVRPMPPMMLNEAQGPEKIASRTLDNFVSWIWSQKLSDLFNANLTSLLKEVWNDQMQLVLYQVGKHARRLSATFTNEIDQSNCVLDFQELSEGERMLIMLYAIVAYQRSVAATTIIIDEPDNFVSIAELQPWLLKFLDERPDSGQIIIVSHNSEIIETMGEKRVTYFERDDHVSPTHVRSIMSDNSSLSLSERLARGWFSAQVERQADVDLA